jgi:MFS family permease
VGRIRLLLGISVFWLALSMLFDGVNTLVLPHELTSLVAEHERATALGLLSFVGLLAGMLVQPIAGAASDRLRDHWGRRRFIGLGVLLILLALAGFGVGGNLILVFAGYVGLQVAAAVAQAAQQGFIPDLVPPAWRGTAAGLKGFMDVGGALVAFALLGALLGSGQVGPALAVIGAAIGGTYLLTLVLVHEPLTGAAPPPARISLAGAFQLDLRAHRTFAWLVASRFLFLLGTYAVGRFFLYFITDRLRLDPDQAAGQAGGLLAGMTLVTVLAALPAGWAADRWGRLPLMLAGAAVSALGTLGLIVAGGAGQILLFGALMAVGSAAFAGANWALTADVAPPAEAARFFGLANVGTAGAAAAAGLFGPLIDGANAAAPGLGYTVLFAGATLAFVLSGAVLGFARPAARQSVIFGE